MAKITYDRELLAQFDRQLNEAIEVIGRRSLHLAIHRIVNAAIMYGQMKQIGGFPSRIREDLLEVEKKFIYNFRE